MLLALTLIAAVLVLVGASMSLFRNRSAVEYYRTIVADGRNDPSAKHFMFFYYTGYVLMITGAGLLLFSLGKVIFTP
jgi:hypothetical protein